MNQDLIFMKRALELSKKGQFSTCPNPMVGAVIVKDGRIIGEGWHQGPGLPHAEIEALKNCRIDPGGATMYVTLEPCNHYGRTPPCSEAIIKAGIATVKYAIPDPNPVAGGGAERLREAGIKTEAGVGKTAALELNRRFLHFCLTGRPWVIMKAAMSLDGKIAAAGGESKWITGERSRKIVHGLRGEVSSVLVGSGTLLADDPRLTNRMALPAVRQPFKVLLDGKLQVTKEHKLAAEEPEKLIVFCSSQASASKEKELTDLGVRVFRQETSGRIDPVKVLETLGRLDIQSVLVEGGRSVFTSFWEAGLINEYYLFYAPFFIGGNEAPGVLAGRGLDSLLDVERLFIKSVKRVGADILVHAYKEEPKDCLQV
ncbi:MAG: bifunctional diaminohydroxyphosphoribosylaminopyrimidine deaminase/5-amino-6-(5-phosphoribosylamino)uracil reductase RibD [Firmicutes bacterium]|nr:bifunctional diaminohydroxyphosphoribosylaminopyrimidine deaminase/5-amino-6-(5-phosphoribosylamino)uracil reductase RibD [Bacillota bacterium]